MSTPNDAIDKARADAQDLHKKIMAVTSTDQAAIKADFGAVATTAQQLATSLKTAAQAQQPNAQQYLNSAASSMQDAATHAKDAAQGAAPELASARAKVVAELTDSLNSVSHAIAAKRSAQQPAHA